MYDFEWEWRISCFSLANWGCWFLTWSLLMIAYFYNISVILLPFWRYRSSFSLSETVSGMLFAWRCWNIFYKLCKSLDRGVYCSSHTPFKDKSLLPRLMTWMKFKLIKYFTINLTSPFFCWSNLSSSSCLFFISISRSLLLRVKLCCYIF